MPAWVSNVDELPVATYLVFGTGIEHRLFVVVHHLFDLQKRMKDDINPSSL